MAWIESHIDLEMHPKLLLFKSRMRWSKNEAVGFLHRFWWTVLRYAPDGVITALPPEVVSETLGMDLDLLKQAIAVMEEPEIALLDRCDGSLLVHDWLDYAGRYLRDSKFKRQPKKWRLAAKAHLSADSPPTVGRTRPNHTKPNQTKPPPTPPSGGGAPKPKVEDLPIPPDLDSPEFREVWSEFVAHRREIRKPITARAARMMLKQLAAWGPSRAIAGIRRSIANGWQGIFEDRGGSPSNGHAPRTDFAAAAARIAAKEKT